MTGKRSIPCAPQAAAKIATVFALIVSLLSSDAAGTKKSNQLSVMNGAYCLTNRKKLLAFGLPHPIVSACYRLILLAAM